MSVHITQHHIANVVYAEARRRGRREDIPLRVLDAGCGDGQLVGWLTESLPRRTPPITVEAYGFDVSDFEKLLIDDVPKAIQSLTQRFPGVPWGERLSLITTRDPWPYPESFFDAIVSNQVLEHVEDHEYFFSELARTLKPGGFSVHLFPSRHTVVEPHMFIPFAHWFQDPERARRHILRMLRIGIGNHRFYPQFSRSELHKLAEHNVYFLRRFTHYLTLKEIAALARRYSLRVTFGYTPGLYPLKARAVLRGSTEWAYRRPGGPARERLLPSLLKYGPGGVTVLFERPPSAS
jgi:SAM-dependent methyltransferase